MPVFNMPDVGEGLTDAEILTWHVSPGDTVTINQVIVEIETAKAAVELPSPYAGTVAELLAAPGETVAVGAPIISISDGSEVGAPAADGVSEGGRSAAGVSPVGPSGNPETSAAVVASASGAGMVTAAAEPDPGPGGAKIGEVTADGRIATLVGYIPAPGSVTRRRRKQPGERSAERDPGDEQRSAERSAVVPLAKPPVRKLARELGIDLHGLVGSGPGGVITRDDVRAGAPTAGATAAVGSNGIGAMETPVPRTASPETASSVGGVRRVAVRGVRRATAAAMVSSAFTAPHVTEFLTVDVTPMIELRDRLRARRDWAGVKLSPLTFAAKAVCLAARRTPEVNASWGEHEIVYYDRVQLGIAAATPRGLIVPKIRDADLLTLKDLATALTTLTDTARAGTTEPRDLINGTFTITNVGVFGVDTGTPIINPGESAILALGAVKQAPWVVDGQLAVRTVCQLALSFDHRVVDGEQGSRFLADVGALMADPGLALTY